jgi:hypothetical protein
MVRITERADFYFAFAISSLRYKSGDLTKAMQKRHRGQEIIYRAGSIDDASRWFVFDYDAASPCALLIPLLQYATCEVLMPFSIFPSHRLLSVYCLGFLFLMTFMMLSSGPVYADWEEIAVTEDGLTTYADPATIRRKGDLVKMWVLSDYNLAQRAEGPSFIYLSSRSQQQFDCVEERSRWLAAAYFSGNMEKSEIVFRKDSEGRWKPVHPRSAAQALWAFACDKK